MRKLFSDDTVLADENKADIVVRGMGDLVEVLPETEEELIERANALYTVQNKSGYYLGLLFAKKEQVIKSGFDNWKKMHKSISDKPPVSSLYEWFRFHGDELQFSYSHAKNCISLFLANDQAAGELLGPQKHSILKKLPEPEYKKAVEKVISESLSTSQVKDYVRTVKDTIEQRQEEQRVYEHEVRPKLPRFNVRIDGTSVIIECLDGSDTGGVVDFLVKHEETLKRHMYYYQKK